MLKRIFATLLILSFTFAVVSAQDSEDAEATDSPAWLRAAHMVADAPAVDVYINDTLTVENLAFTDISDYLPLAPGEYTIAITPAGEGLEAALLEPRSIDLMSDHTYIVAAAGLVEDDTLAVLALDETGLIERTATDNPQMGELNTLSRFIFVHALDGIGDLALIFQTGEIVLPGISYGSFYATPVIPGTFPMLIVTSAAENQIVSEALNPVTFSPQLLYFVAVVGTPENPQTITSVTGVQTFADLLTSSDALETMSAAFAAAGLIDPFATEAGFTVFLPSDAALEAAGIDLEALANDPEQFTAVLQNHIVAEKLDPQELAEQDSVTTLAGNTLSIEIDQDNNIILGDSVTFARVGIQTLNATIYPIDTVLIPSDE